jgi:hypothetical protein
MFFAYIKAQSTLENEGCLDIGLCFQEDAYLLTPYCKDRSSMQDFVHLHNK